MKQSLWGWVLFCILSTATLAFGQTATTSLRGTIKDPTGALVPGAKITLTDKATGKTSAATAKQPGFYTFPQIPPRKLQHHGDTPPASAIRPRPPNCWSTSLRPSISR